MAAAISKQGRKRHSNLTQLANQKDEKESHHHLKLRLKVECRVCPHFFHFGVNLWYVKDHWVPLGACWRWLCLDSSDSLA